MEKRYIELITDYLAVNETISEDERELYEFGVKQVLAILQNLLCTIFIAFLFGNVVETIYFLGAFIVLRSYAGGFHASSGKKCFVYSLLFIIIVEHIFVLCSIDNVIMFSWCVANYIIICYSPIENENKPISIKERVSYRHKVRCILFAEAIVALLPIMIVQIRMAVIIAVISEAVLILMAKYNISALRKRIFMRAGRG